MRAYYIHALAEDFAARVARAAAMGFDHVVVSPVSAAGHSGNVLRTRDLRSADPRLGEGPVGWVLASRVAVARDAGLGLILDLVIDRVASDATQSIDPRHAPDDWDARAPDYDGAFGDLVAGFMRDARDAGVAGFRVIGVDRTPPGFVAHVAANAGDATLIGWFPGAPASVRAELAGLFGYVATSLPWWDFEAAWFWEEVAAIRAAGATPLHPAEAPFAQRAHGHARERMALAALSGVWMLPMGAEDGAVLPLDPTMAPHERRAADAPLREFVAALNWAEPLLGLGPLGAPGARPVLLGAAGGDWRRAREARVAVIGAGTADVFGAVAAAGGLPARLDPMERVAEDVAVARVTLAMPEPVSPPQDARAAGAVPRLAIEAVTPACDDGAFATRMVLGATLRVECDVVTDGHDVSAVMLHWRPPGRAAAERVRMAPLGNDRYAAEVTPRAIGTGQFLIEAWRDVFGTYHHELEAKHNAGVPTSLELREGAALVTPAIGKRLAALPDEDAKRALLLAPETVAAMAEADPRAGAATSRAYPVWVERAGAAFASWYEVFPRSLSDDPARHGTFDDVIRHLPRVAAMGFDVLYFPPIHPIGRTNRKGRNNALVAEPGEPGSPYAIGSDEGGHDALHPELGTFEDFERLVAAAAGHGLEIALDFAVQCAPDHPWLKRHADWFVWRPDGSIRYAENPPKKYQDIVNVDFYAAGARPALWEELTRIVLFWCSKGVRLFRVDNPHTKPFPFWEYLIATVRARHPDAVFLAEAFTRPKVMARLAKVGFSQSYTYFTWRNTAAEITQYLTELQGPPWAGVFRPHFFVNTPDINPPFLQTGGRPAHLIRAALAAMLSGLWGVYNGFELCEATPLPGREEYLDSEKYQLRAWDWDRPGNIVAEITRLNAIRRANPALHTHLGVVFLAGTDPDVVCFQKATADRANVVMAAISMDPARERTTEFDVPLWRDGIADDGAIVAENLVTGGTEVWRGRRRTVTLTPALPYAVWRVRPEE